MRQEEPSKTQQNTEAWWVKRMHTQQETNGGSCIVEPCDQIDFKIIVEVFFGCCVEDELKMIKSWRRVTTKSTTRHPLPGLLCEQQMDMGCVSVAVNREAQHI
jgi:hypothetical protein